MEQGAKQTKIPKKMILIILIVIIAMAAVISGYFLYRSSKIITPEKRLEQYVGYLNEKKYDDMYELLAEDVKSTVTKEDFAAVYNNTYGGMEANHITIEIEKADDSDSIKESARTISYHITLDTLAGELSYDNSAIFSKDKKANAYFLNWSSQDIHPDLKKGDTIKAETVTPKRGQILDRNGKVLAGEGVASSVGIVPGKLPDDREGAISALSQLLEVSSEKIEKTLSAKWVKEDSFVPLRTVSKDAMELKSQLLGIAGVKIADTKERYYPLGKAAAQLVGYMQSITAEELEEMPQKGYTANSQIGKGGIEKLYEDQLKGTIGCKLTIFEGTGAVKGVLLEQPVKDGEDITLTIDSDLQNQVYQEIQAEQGLGVAMNPKTGEVLAMVSTPSYDPNDFVMGYTSAAWDAVNNDPAKPLYNRYKAAWAPGSAFKPVVAALGITNQTMDPSLDMAHDPLKWQKDGSWGSYYVTTLEDYNPKNLENALIYSDNIYFAQAALAMGNDTFSKGLTSLGFGETMPFEFEFTASSYGSEGKIEKETELADSGYGQGKVLANPLHLLAMYSAFVNDGSMIQPFLIKKEGQQAAFWKENVFTKEASDTVLQDLVQVVDNPDGTGHAAMIEGKSIAGKTGTAEIKDSKEDLNGTELGYFLGMTAVDTTKPILMGIMVENVKDRGGSHVAVPMVKTCLESYLQ